MTFTEFLNAHGLVVQIVESESGKGHHAKIERTEVKDGALLRGALGRGLTRAEALQDLARDVVGETLVVDAMQPTARTIEVPDKFDEQDLEPTIRIWSHGGWRDAHGLYPLIMMIRDEAIAMLEWAHAKGVTDEEKQQWLARINAAAGIIPYGEDQTGLPAYDPSKPKEEQGLFAKFYVRRTDGSDAPGGKHDGCFYFVLDLDHDPFAAIAAIAYATACERKYPQLSADLLSRVEDKMVEKARGRSAELTAALLDTFLVIADRAAAKDAEEN